MSSKGMDVLICFIPENIYYITGYQTPGCYVFQCLLIPVDREPFMVTRYLEEINMVALSWLEDRAFFQDWEDPVEKTIRAMEERKLASNKTIGIGEDAWFLSFRNHTKLKHLLPNAALVDGSGCIENLRLIKSLQEIEYIRHAAWPAEKGTEAGMRAIKPGVSEDEIAGFVHYEMIRNGCEYPRVAPFVA